MKFIKCNDYIIYSTDGYEISDKVEKTITPNYKRKVFFAKDRDLLTRVNLEYDGIC